MILNIKDKSKSRGFTAEGEDSEKSRAGKQSGHYSNPCSHFTTEKTEAHAGKANLQ